MEKVLATLLTIGDELLIGQVIDTNSAWIAQQLNGIGILVKKRVSVGDDAADIEDALQQAAAESSIVLITGGLGPTADDITKPVLCKYFDSKLVLNEEALDNVKAIFARHNRELIDRNIRQAEVPHNCRVIQNPRGTAPGMWFEKNGIVYVSMPGVPHEMKGMMENEILPSLAEKFQTPVIEHRTIMVAGIGESFLAELIQPWEEKLPSNIKLAYLPNYGLVRLRMTGMGNNADSLSGQLDKEFNELQQLVQRYLVSTRDETLEFTIAQMLSEKNKTMGTAESCTGGYLAHLFTKDSGASKTFFGGIVCYDNSVKEKLLGVKAETLAAHGAVSEEVVIEMVEGARAAMGVDYALATSGILGPGGGSILKPVGTVWIAVASAEKTVARKFLFQYDRKRNLLGAATQGLNMLRELIAES